MTSLTPDERAFYDSSRAYDDAERAARRRRRRVLTTILGISAVVGLSLGAIAVLQANRAEANASVARSRELAASAEAALSTDPALAKMLAVASTRFAEPTADTMSILHRAFAADRVLSRYAWPLDDFHGADLHPGRSLIAATGADPARLEIYDMEEGGLEWAWEGPGGTLIVDAHFTDDGAYVLAGVLADGDDPVGDLGIHMWDAPTGELVRVFDLVECSRDVIAAFEVDRTLAVTGGRAFTAHPSGDCDGTFATVGVLDLASGEWSELVPMADPWTVSGDGRFLAYTDTSASYVIEVATGEVVLQFNRSNHPGSVPDGFVQLLKHDGSLLVAGERPMAVWDVATGEIVAEFHGHPGEAHAWEFSADGQTVYSSGREGTVSVWTAADGGEVDSFPAVGSGRVAIAGSRILVSDPVTDRARLLDGEIRGEVWAMDTCQGFVLSTGLTRVVDQIAVAQVCGDEGDWRTFLIDVGGTELREWGGYFGQHQSISPDGTRLVRQEQVAQPVVTADGVTQTVGPMVIRDLTTGDVIVELEGLCTYEYSFAFTPETRAQCEEYPSTPFAMFNLHTGWTFDSDYVVAVRPGVTVWEAATGEIVSIMDDETVDGCLPSHMLAAPDGDSLFFGCFDDDLILELPIDTWEPRLIEVEGGRGTLVAFTPDGEHLVGIEDFSALGRASLGWLDAKTFEIVAAFEEVTQGAAKSYALSPDGRVLAIGTSEGFVHIWDIVERRPVQEIFVAPTQMQGVAFLSDAHLAVAPQPGGVLVYTLDPVELSDVVASSLTRGFTQRECERYGFGAACPTLEELSGR